jgi:predicted DCC family thiol-disulfide oxidoreductase YuxK
LNARTEFAQGEGIGEAASGEHLAGDCLPDTAASPERIARRTMRRLATFARLGRDGLAGLEQAWARFWFQSQSTAPLELARIGIGGALLLHYAMASPYLFEVWGDTGWMPRALALQHFDDPWRQSVFFYFTAPWQWVAFHALFLLCCTAFMLGWRTTWIKWIVLVGQISYANRNEPVSYGVDKVLACLLIILCVAPIGRALSLDRVRAVRAAKRNCLRSVPPSFSSAWAGACTRLMQIQMAVLFLHSGLGKRGDDWWSGDAIWSVFATNEFYSPFLLDLLSRQYWLVNAGTYMTILIEIAYPFLIWQRRSRPYLLAAALALHGAFAALMAFYYFSFIMMMGHMGFVRPEWLQRLGGWWKSRIGKIEITYDGRCSFCVRSLAWLLAFDGLQQISVRDLRTDPGPAVADAPLEQSLYLVPPDGQALRGFDAVRYVVLRVPGLWWLLPLFHVPVVSRLIGHSIYDRVAAKGGRLPSAESSLPPRVRAKP